MREFKTPGIPNLKLVQLQENLEPLSKEYHKIYCSGVGMLLYLVKYLRPDIANTVRELSKVLDKSTKTSYK